MIDYFDLSLKESTLFDNYKPKAYDDLLLALKLADEKVTQRILKTNGEWTKRELNKTKALINEEIDKAYSDLYPSMQTDSVAVAGVVFNATAETISQALPKAAVSDLINSKRQIQNYDFKELFQITQDNHARQLRILLASGVSQGLTAAQIAKEYNIKSGKLSRGQVVSNIFTTVTDSRAKGRYEAYKTLESRGIIKEYEYSATLDSGTSVYCREWDGRIRPAPIENIAHLVHTHFNCRSSWIAKQEFESNIRPSQFGETANNNYETWYLKQDKSFYKSTLANKKYNAFLKGKYKVKSLNDIDKKTNLATVAKELKPKAVPTIKFGYGGKFDGYVKDIRDEAKIVISKLPKPNSLKLTSKRGSYVSDTKILTTIKSDKTFVHEYGHHLDNNALPTRQIGKFTITPKLSFRHTFKNAYNKDRDIYNFIDINNVVKLIDDSGYDVKTKKAFGISDILDSFRDGYIREFHNKAGHGIAGYESDLTKHSETFANMFEIYSRKNEWARAKKLFPNLSAEMENIISELIK